MAIKDTRFQYTLQPRPYRYLIGYTLDSAVIDSTCLNNSNFHLNAKGTSLRAVDQFIRFLRSSLSNGQFSNGRKSGFRMSLMKLLGETVKTILEQTQGQH